MLCIRLQRIGKKKQPSYRLVVSEKKRDTQSGSLEMLGIYNPLVKPKVIKFNNERIAYWLSKGAQTSGTVHNMLLDMGLVKGKKENVVTINKKRAEKMKKEAGKKEANSEQKTA